MRLDSSNCNFVSATCFFSVCISTPWLHGTLSGSSRIVGSWISGYRGRHLAFGTCFRHNGHDFEVGRLPLKFQPLCNSSSSKIQFQLLDFNHLTYASHFSMQNWWNKWPQGVQAVPGVAPTGVLSMLSLQIAQLIGILKYCKGRPNHMRNLILYGSIKVLWEAVDICLYHGSNTVKNVLLIHSL